MRGEIGMGTMKSRIVRSRLQYLRRKMKGKKELVKGVVEEMRVDISRWKRTEKHMEWAAVHGRELNGMSQSGVRGRVVDGVWQAGVKERILLAIHGIYRGKMMEVVNWGENDSKLWFRARGICLCPGGAVTGEEEEGCRTWREWGALGSRNYCTSCWTAKCWRQREGGTFELQRPRLQEKQGKMSEEEDWGQKSDIKEFLFWQKHQVHPFHSHRRCPYPVFSQFGALTWVSFSHSL